jgi:hypothetical protein
MSRPRTLSPMAMLVLMLALPSCSQSVESMLQRDEAAYDRASEQLMADRDSGNTAALSTDADAYEAALDQLRYDRMSEPDSEGRGHHDEPFHHMR